MKGVKVNLKAVPEVMKTLGMWGKKRLPSILTAFGIGGMLMATVMAANDAPKYQSAVKKAERDKAEELGMEYGTAKLTKNEKIRIWIGFFWREIVIDGVSIFVICYSDHMQWSSVASITGMYIAKADDLKELRKKIIQTDGEEKLKEYEKSIHMDTMVNEQVNNPSMSIVNTGHGTTVFFEPISKTFFYSDIWHVQKALREMVAQCNEYGHYRLSELMTDLDLPDNDIWDYFSFYHESMNDIDVNGVEQLFDYHSIDFDNGDFRPCIWLDIKNRVYYNQMNDGGGLFRAKYSDC